MEVLEEVLLNFSRDEAIDFTRQLVRIPSVVGNEKHLADHLSAELITLGLRVENVEAQKDRPNLIARIPGQTNVQGLILVGHMDTVSEDQGSDKPWTIRPFAGQVQNECLYGLGSADMKGGIASIFLAVRAILSAGVKLRRGLTIVFCVDEEEGSQYGMKYIAEKNLVKGNLAIAADTTNMCLQGWFKGRTIYEIESRGKTAHPSNPAKGINAINHMVNIIHKINHDGFKHKRHGFLGECTTNFGLIQGGKDVKSIPDLCRSLLEVRTVPGQTGPEVKEEIDGHISELKQIHPTIDASVKITTSKDPMEVSPSDPIIEMMQNASQKATGKKLQLGRAGIGGGDLYFLWKFLGIPGINFGPGDVELAHSPDEHVRIDSIVDAAKCYAAFVLELCSGYT